MFSGPLTSSFVSPTPPRFHLLQSYSLIVVLSLHRNNLFFGLLDGCPTGRVTAVTWSNRCGIRTQNSTNSRQNDPNVHCFGGVLFGPALECFLGVAPPPAPHAGRPGRRPPAAANLFGQSQNAPPPGHRPRLSENETTLFENSPTSVGNHDDRE